MKLKTIAASICLLASAQYAQAVLVDFYGVGATATSKELSFQQALTAGTLAVDKLEDNPACTRGWYVNPLDPFDCSSTGVVSPDAGGLPLIFDSIASPGTTKGGNLKGTSQIVSAPIEGRSPHSGVSYWTGEDFTITFDDAVSAFGFWGSDIGDFSNGCTTPGCKDRGITIQLFDELGVSLGDFWVKGDGNNGSVLFWGFVDTAAGPARVKSVRITDVTGSQDGQGFDDFMIGQVRADFDPGTPNPAPEPGVLALVGLALAGAARARRRH